MKKTLFILLWSFAALLPGQFAQASACRVHSPDDFADAFENLSRGGCASDGKGVLQFDGSMDVFINSPLVLGQSAGPVLIEAEEGATVRLIGSKEIKEPGLNVKGSEVTLSNLIFRDFPGTAIRVEGNHVILQKLKLLHSGGAALVLTGNDIAVKESEIANSGGDGVVITDEESSANCAGLLLPVAKARNIALVDTEIDHNAGYGVAASGYQTRVESTESGRAMIHDNGKAGVFLDAASIGWRCKKEGSGFDPLNLHTILVSKVSFYDNGGDAIQTTGPVFPAPQGLVGVPDAHGNLVVTGHIPFSTAPSDPWSLGLVSYSNVRVEIYEGRIFLGVAEKVLANGDFQTVIPKNVAPSGNSLSLTAIATDKLLNVSSPFSVSTPEDHPSDAADVDGDGIPDTEEDLNLNGRVDFNETDPRNPDTDSDGLNDGEERLARLNPADPDTDGDCLPDGLEAGVTKERILELQKGTVSSILFLPLSTECVEKATQSGTLKPSNGVWKEDVTEDKQKWENLIGLYDADPATKTDPASKDSDDDGLFDATEDKNISGKKEEKETDAAVSDTDDDGLDDGEEDASHNGRLDANETDPLVPDTDGDGLNDGDEVNNFKSDPRKCDSDSDGLGDGLETGKINPDAASPECRGLQAVGSNFDKIRVLDPMNPDSDGDDLNDGEEDANHNGWLDFNETDPTNADTDGDDLDDGVEKNIDTDLSLIHNGEKCSPPPDKNDLDCDGVVNGRDNDNDSNTKPASSSSSSSSTSAPVSPNGGKTSPSESAATGTSTEEVQPSKGGGACQLIQNEDGQNVGWMLIGLLYLALIWTRSVCSPFSKSGS
ncbi:MAG: right-handed parallel beta-helix repeat-containing protein [Deltaproteobacteria bacterium]|nr:right-handed parallel beta-helix repeat-containing protein [Deltaproteobacteria bacterium]